MVDHTGHHTRFISFLGGPPSTKGKVCDRVNSVTHHTRASGGMADTIVLGTIVARREGSSPFSPTKCSYSLVVEHIHGKDTAQVRFLVGAPQKTPRKHPFPQVDGITRYAIIKNNLTKGEKTYEKIYRSNTRKRRESH